MYRCDSCCEIFSEPESIMDIVTTDPYPMGPMIGICPYCGHTEFEEVVACPDCEEYVSEEELVLVEFEDGTSKHVCTECYENNYFIPPNVEED